MSIGVICVETNGTTMVSKAFSSQLSALSA
ncbi:MAG: hypothetical protein RLZ63_306 [Pseudomonadota bacterium]|jgi:hypothetical protein